MFTNFLLNEIKLADHEFAGRRELVRQYLTLMDENHLLHTFRLNAGLVTEAEPLGGWEAPECGLHGHLRGTFFPHVPDLHLRMEMKS